MRPQSEAEEVVHFFASRLKRPGSAELAMVADEQLESLVRALVITWRLRRVPQEAVWNRPNTVTLKMGRDGVVTKWNTYLPSWHWSRCGNSAAVSAERERTVSKISSGG